MCHIFSKGSLSRWDRLPFLQLIQFWLFLRYSSLDATAVFAGKDPAAAGICFGTHLLIEIQMRCHSPMLSFLLPLAACEIPSGGIPYPIYEHISEAV